MSSHDDTPSLFPEPIESQNDAAIPGVAGDGSDANQAEARRLKVNAAARKWRAENPDRVKQIKKECLARERERFDALPEDEKARIRKERNERQRARNERIKADPEKLEQKRLADRAKSKRWAEQNPERYREIWMAAKARNRESTLARLRERYADDEEFRQKSNQASRNWKEKFPAKHYRYRQERIQRHREYVDGLLVASGCSRCPEKDIRCLCFHHVDPATKVRPVSQMLARRIEVINAEIAKCIVLCNNCHYLSHADDAGVVRLSPSAQRKPEEPVAREVGLSAAEEMQARRRRRVNQRYAENREFFQALKATLSCKKCGESRTPCLQFHHKKQGPNVTRVSDLVNASRKRLLAEISRCVALCANCHGKSHVSKIEGFGVMKIRIQQTELPFGD